ncbi:MAG: FKBP-type peptidyl-prolyl cis-trans isomerase [Sphingobacteriales bacterium]|nr:FKBP-type peptidyl-prolyl cis-trans isomerase [Sphingobacteriales bacterium]
MKNNIAKCAFAGILLLTVFSACKKEYATIQQEDSAGIANYIQTNNLAGMTEYTTSEGNTKSGIFYQVLEPGTGAVVNNTDIVYLTYTVKSFDGVSVYTEENLYRYISYLGYLDKTTSGLPTAFRTAVRDILKKKGGKIRLLIPSNQAYGVGGTNSIFKIAGNQSLDCTITLYDVDSKQSFEDIFVQKYITASAITGLTKTASGLYYQIIAPGTGTEVFPYSNISAVFTGKLTDGTVFDEALTATPFSAILSDVIPSWTEGLQLIKKGGKIRLIVPPTLGYGSTAKTGIPPNSILDFNIELLDVTN